MIHFQVPQTGGTVKTLVEILDLQGRRVARLQDEVLAPGSHSVRWDGRDAGRRGLPRGAYFARLVRGNETAGVKLILGE
jgi:flagellar hook assembly protein FlgD